MDIDRDCSATRNPLRESENHCFQLTDSNLVTEWTIGRINDYVKGEQEKGKLKGNGIKILLKF